MPANAAGEWIAFDAADPKTWPESGTSSEAPTYLVWVMGIDVDDWDSSRWCGGLWLDFPNSHILFYAAILPPGESPSKEEGK